ncbi:GNAT family N-acetyltransferase [Streptomyces sp. SID9727]|uniref:GNAT family N-acetyltransferase n=1 Tax=Streptomyces sp. SID9727 TaxID=2706114 RepID=UPI0013CB3A37|nr:GNAT family N-acetyltransferase [Streptomyces sp. SID9727]NEC66796.1 GNAT family N-acetyltransferase [Streptomyces sp. SID9727]
MTDSGKIRPLREEDWDEVVALERRAYAASGLSEGEEALRSRHRASPSTCFALEYEGALAGYLLALPYPLGSCPDLSLLEQAGPAATNLHAHDLVIAEWARGRGLASRMLRHLEAAGRASGYRTLSLVAVHGTEEKWAALGYRARPGTPLPASYGPNAVPMARRLDEPS